MQLLTNGSSHSSSLFTSNKRTYRNVGVPVLERAFSSFSYSLGTFFGLVGSIIILIGIKKRAIKLDKITTAMILHIAVLDVLATLIIIFPTALTAVTDLWLFGVGFCAFQAYSRWFLTTSSGLLVCALNCSKLAALLFPFRGRNWTSRHGHILAALVWTFSVVIQLGFHLSEGRTYTRFDVYLLMCDFRIESEKFKRGAIIIFFLALLCTLIVLISEIWLVVIAIKLNLRKGIRTVKFQGVMTVVLVAFVYCVSFLPLFAFYLVAVIDKEEYGYIAVICKSIPLFNNVSNIFIYMISIRSFRLFVKNLLASVLQICCYRRENRVEVTNMTVFPVANTSEHQTRAAPRTSGNASFSVPLSRSSTAGALGGGGGRGLQPK